MSRRRFTPKGYGEKVAQKLVHAGNPPNLNVDKILVMKLVGLVSIDRLDPARS